jgi:hypothetical protein
MSATPGPWAYDAESGHVFAPKCGYQWTRGAPTVARIEPLDYGESSGNGALIAASPQLLRVLEHVTFLLNSARIVLNDPIARQIAAKAVEEAQAVVKQAKEAK